MDYVDNELVWLNWYRGRVAELKTRCKVCPSPEYPGDDTMREGCNGCSLISEYERECRDMFAELLPERAQILSVERV